MEPEHVFRSIEERLPPDVKASIEEERGIDDVTVPGLQKMYKRVFAVLSSDDSLPGKR